MPASSFLGTQDLSPKPGSISNQDTGLRFQITDSPSLNNPLHQVELTPPPSPTLKVPSCFSAQTWKNSFVIMFCWSSHCPSQAPKLPLHLYWGFGLGEGAGTGPDS